MNKENLPIGIYIGKGSCGIAAGAGKIELLLKKELPSISIGTKGCIGSCYLEPVIEVFRHREFFSFVQVDKEKALEIVKWLKGERDLPHEYLILDEDKKNLKAQNRIALKNCGVIDPEDIDWYISPPTDGYQGFKKALQMTSQEVIDEIKISGLKGRGGAGFPTHFKWQATRDSNGENKYIICNADEGDPGAFMDRAILEGDPHAVLEGMMIAGYAIGAARGIFYVRAEYPLAIKRLEIAMRQAAEKGYLGKNILNSGFDFTLSLKEGAGAFVCGEETA
ncbi:MAG: NADH-quinone oxidoreductase subunit F, partial [Firmicutes bacterium]|nr:NADH-quinone oxidoreductase subunit F [Bacillota bacterium]